jgi:hypothetical protein
MANGHSTGSRLKDNPYATFVGNGIVNAEGQLVRQHVSHPTRPAIERFLEKVKVSEVLFHNGSPCWEWTGCKSKTTGYGQFKPDGRRGSKLSSPHRFSYEHHVGPIPEGHEVDHLCNVRHCCNPLHLEAVTVQVNRKRRVYDEAHCKHGHEMTGDNLYLSPAGTRFCRKCRRNRVSEFHAKHPGYNAEKCQAYQAKRKQHNNTDDAS